MVVDRPSGRPAPVRRRRTGGRAHFAAWQQGRTGFPYIDAAMRQLLAEGWMHNRARMGVASFLIKDLHLPWQRGAKHFMDHLVDGDLSSNNHGWQWAAGVRSAGCPVLPSVPAGHPGAAARPGGRLRAHATSRSFAAYPGKAVHTPVGSARRGPRRLPGTHRRPRCRTAGGVKALGAAATRLSPLGSGQARCTGRSPQVASKVSPGSSHRRPMPELNASAGQVIGSTATVSGRPGKSRGVNTWM